MNLSQVWSRLAAHQSVNNELELMIRHTIYKIWKNLPEFMDIVFWYGNLINMNELTWMNIILFLNSDLT